jgi:hypothetical protein
MRLARCPITPSPPTAVRRRVLRKPRPSFSRPQISSKCRVGRSERIDPVDEPPRFFVFLPNPVKMDMQGAFGHHVVLCRRRHVCDPQLCQYPLLQWRQHLASDLLDHLDCLLTALCSHLYLCPFRTFTLPHIFTDGGSVYKEISRGKNEGAAPTPMSNILYYRVFNRSGASAFGLSRACAPLSASHISRRTFHAPRTGAGLWR